MSFYPSPNFDNIVPFNGYGGSGKSNNLPGDVPSQSLNRNHHPVNGTNDGCPKQNFKNSFSSGNPYNKQRYQGNQNQRFQRKPQRNRCRQNNRAPNFIAFCDRCDRGFKTSEQKEEHFKQHVKCQEPGCTFEAHVKVVEIHWQNVHSSFAKKLNLNVNEDDKVWRQERKSKFPTLARVQQKKELESQKSSKGVVLPTQKRKFPNKNQKGRFKRPRRNPGSDGFPMASLEENKEKEKSSDQKVYEKSSNPMDLLMSGEKSDQSDNETISENVAVPTVKAQECAQSGLMSLMAAYGSDTSDDDSEMPQTVPQAVDQTKMKSSSVEKITERLDETNKFKQPTDEANKAEKQKSQQGQHSNEKHPHARPPNERKHTRRNNRRKPHRNGNEEKPFMSTKSLLQKLLEREITDERNKILQCVRFIINNHFFANDEIMETNTT